MRTRASSPSGLSFRRELAIRPLVPQHECQPDVRCERRVRGIRTVLLVRIWVSGKKKGSASSVRAWSMRGLSWVPPKHIRRRGRRHRACSRPRWSVVALQKDKGFSIANPQRCSHCRKSPLNSMLSLPETSASRSFLFCERTPDCKRDCGCLSNDQCVYLPLSSNVLGAKTDFPISRFSLALACIRIPRIS